jgi:hypothetical protein
MIKKGNKPILFFYVSCKLQIWEIALVIINIKTQAWMWKRDFYFYIFSPRSLAEPLATFRGTLGFRGTPVEKGSLEDVGASTSHNPMGLHGRLQDTFTFKKKETFLNHAVPGCHMARLLCPCRTHSATVLCSVFAVFHQAPVTTRRCCGLTPIM